MSDEQIAIALMLNEASVRNLEEVVGAIRSGQLPEFKNEDFEKFMEQSRKCAG